MASHGTAQSSPRWQPQPQPQPQEVTHRRNTMRRRRFLSSPPALPLRRLGTAVLFLVILLLLLGDDARSFGVGVTRIHALSLPSNNPKVDNNNDNNIRLNKVFKATHSRRKADVLIAEGRVKVNGEIVHDMGRRVVPYADMIELDQEPYTGWEEENENRLLLDLASPSSSTVKNEQEEDNATRNNSKNNQQAILSSRDEYIKYWKPVGITCTTDPNVPGNLLEGLGMMMPNNNNNNLNNQQLQQREQRGEEMAPSSTFAESMIQSRIFSVGRLDKDSSGLLLLTSDGRVPNAVLRKEFKRPKTYRVTVDKPLTNRHLQQLRQGVVITTDTVRQGKHKALTAPTLPCRVERVKTNTSKNAADNDGCTIQITLQEGRNRQIRVMLKSVGGYHVVDLHRIDFMGITLDGLNGPGDWTRLDESELAIVQNAIANAARKEQGKMRLKKA